MHNLVDQLSRALLARFGWHVVEDTGVWRYMEHRETGERRVRRIGPGEEPVDHNWLADTRYIWADEEWLRQHG